MTDKSSIRDAVYLYFDRKAPVLFFILSLEGEILSANRYATELTRRNLIGQSFYDVMIDFSGEFDLITALNEPSVERIIHVGVEDSTPQTFYFTFEQNNDCILAFGKLNADELEIMRKEILSLNWEQSNLMRKLHQANAHLKRLNQEKNRFLGMAAHDLRKPIGLVLAYTDFLIDEARNILNREHMGFLNTIKGSSLFMKQLVDDFLDVSAIEAGRFELDLQPVSIETVLAHCLQFNKRQAAKKAIDLKVKCADNLPTINIDMPKIEQAIINLVSNAIEHTRLNSSVIISLSCTHQFVVFSVQDSGSGIAPDEMDTLFKPFEKTSSKKTAGEKSTGLGLLITRKIIDAHDGKIWINSSVGQGTTISFKIPIRSE